MLTESTDFVDGHGMTGDIAPDNEVASYGWIGIVAACKALGTAMESTAALRTGTYSTLETT